LNYTYDVENTGNVTITNIVVTDNLIPSISCPVNVLLPGAQTPASDQETVNGNLTPALTLIKTATTPSYNTLGDTVDYTYVVTNSGNVTITSPIIVSDDKISSVSCPALPASGLLPTQSIICSATYTVTQADIDVGSVGYSANLYGGRRDGFI